MQTQAEMNVATHTENLRIQSLWSDVMAVQIQIWDVAGENHFPDLPNISQRVQNHHGSITLTKVCLSDQSDL